MRSYIVKFHLTMFTGDAGFVRVQRFDAVDRFDLDCQVSYVLKEYASLLPVHARLTYSVRSART